MVTVWSGLNLLVGTAVTVTTVLAGSPPALALVLDRQQISSVDPRLIAIVNAQALIANPCIVALCALVLVLVWRGVIRGLAWALWALIATLPPLQVFGFVSDALLGHRNVALNAASSILLLAGLGMCAGGYWRTSRQRELLARRPGPAVEPPQSG